MKSSLNFACLACGIGDARNVFASFLLLDMMMEADQGATNWSHKSLHFTLVSLKAAVFTGDLIMFRILIDAEIIHAESKKG